MGRVDAAQFLGRWTDTPVAYNRRDLLLYAVGIGCSEQQWVYEKHPEFAPFPTYPVVLCFKGNEQDVVQYPSPAQRRMMPAPPLPGVRAMVDWERYVERVRALPRGGAQLTLRTRMVGVQPRGSGAVCSLEQHLCDPSGTVYYRFRTSFFMVGARDFVPAGRSVAQTVPPPRRPPDAVAELPTAPGQAQLFRLACGDWNPLHIDPAAAARAGFAAPLLHGLCTLALCARAVLRHFGGNAAESFRALNARFAAPVVPGDTLRVEMWREGPRVIFRGAVKHSGTVCVKDAYMDLAAAGEHTEAKL
eukprot:TRINITY_DN31210_c0_g1_i1.p1 TRINITY_DN31210_c0_g1~~TRINITY_DN31210_c0_g1_i1.p1  ORF type:complete len:325 (+),score=106.00 TRINITY_DN31210_c0_g1_i1:67-975(+)